ncbi:hypothetical protein [Amycolatopsis sp. WGS_07]|uniref:hypothetical protein n=1 Tax=Amycolatopsis sp. WGS_07 TaxID=3076764 RepID=UPI003872DD2A
MRSNLAPVLSSLSPYSNAVLRIGALLILKEIRAESEEPDSALPAASENTR